MRGKARKMDKLILILVFVLAQAQVQGKPIKEGDKLKVLPWPSGSVYVSDPCGGDVSYMTYLLRKSAEWEKWKTDHGWGEPADYAKLNSDLANHVAEVKSIRRIKAEPPAPDQTVIQIRIDELGETLYLHTYGEASTSDIADFALPFEEMANARKMIGKGFWKRGIPSAFADWVSNTDIKGHYHRKFHVYAVELDPKYPGFPLKFMLRASGGYHGYFCAWSVDDFRSSWTDVNPRTKHPGWSDTIWRAIESGKVLLGMTADQVVESIGEPRQIHRTLTKGRRSEQWIYGNINIYLVNGRVTAIQD